jgi:hypothetical protein
MPLDQATRDRVIAEAKRRGVDPDAAIAAAEKVAPKQPAHKDAPAADAPARPIADRLLIGFLPFIKVRELRAVWLGLDERIPDDELTCGDYQIKHGVPTAATAGGSSPDTDSPAGGA